MINLMHAGNIGATSTTLHPNGSAYVVIKRDIPGGCFLVYEQGWDGSLKRLIKMYAGRSDVAALSKLIGSEENAAGRPTPFPIELIDKPLSSPSLVCRPDGSLLVNLTPGGGDGLCDWFVDVIPNACPPWSWQGQWPLTVSATDDEARRLARAAQQRAELATAAADRADDTADEAIKKVKALEKAGASLDMAKVLQGVSDDIALGLQKDASGNRQGKLIHALWQVVGSVLDDLLWIRAKRDGRPIV